MDDSLKCRTFHVIRERNSALVSKYSVKDGSPYSPNDLRSAYKVTPVQKKHGKKQVVITIIIAYHYPYIQECLDNFCEFYNLPKTTLEVINLNTNNPDYYPANGWDIEECIDTQWAYSMNPNAHIRVIEIIDNFITNLYAGVEYASNPDNWKDNEWGVTDIINMSWGVDDNLLNPAYLQTRDPYFSNNNICYFSASGDKTQVSYPATSQNVIGVGGTSLYYDSGSGDMSQTTWYFDDEFAGGCGPSSLIVKPVYQKGVKHIKEYSKRCCPDVACIADPDTGVNIIHTTNGTDFQVLEYGGTSLSCPVTAGIISNLIQSFINHDKPKFTTILPSNYKYTNPGTPILLQDVLYNIIYKNKGSYEKCFYDVVLGNDGPYQTTTRFDIPTGLGSIYGDALIKALLAAIPISNICFPGNTPIMTDQGIINICDLNPSINTIKNNKIVAITQTTGIDDYLVSFAKDCFGLTYPNKETIMTGDHKLFYKGKMIEAKKFIGRFENVKKVNYDGNILYNILMEKHAKVNVNNLKCETLHPLNIIARLYKSTITDDYKNKIINMINYSIKNKDLKSYKKIISTI